ncbi:MULTISPECIES: acyl-CoA dehydrogenase family protein [Rhodomicrobium]|uniref:acyl-CoA dehydrogenase family protein n=1 Tax=Rhodomicrobium TaxID=1068 RepID=UPI000B4BCF3C|nr:MULTISPECIES: acyl-CoA dehydrogenase family protein [Rhodomicrobium]
MDFDLTEEQSLLKDSVDRLIEDRYGDFERRNAYAREPGGWSRAVWRDFAALGLTALPFEESTGGIGGGPLETMIVMEAVGRGLTLEPFFSTVVLGAAALRLGGTEEQRETLVPQIIAGELILALAQGERQARYDLFDVATTARESGDGFVLDGHKTMVIHGDSADRLIVSARSSGGRRDKSGITLFLVDARAPGVEIHGYAGQDAQRVAEITLNGVKAGADAVLGGRDRGHDLLEHVVDIGIAALAAEAVGAMDALHALTLDYLKTRKQFGVAIGNFQALQHRAVDMMIALEQARSMSVLAAMMANAGARERRAAISGAKVLINRSARFVGQQAIQLHGGIGMTMEYKAGHYFKRLTMIEALFGDTDHHLAKVSDAGGLLEEVA